MIKCEYSRFLQPQTTFRSVLSLSDFNLHKTMIINLQNIVVTKMWNSVTHLVRLTPEPSMNRFSQSWMQSKLQQGEDNGVAVTNM